MTHAKRKHKEISDVKGLFYAKHDLGLDIWREGSKFWILAPAQHDSAGSPLGKENSSNSSNSGKRGVGGRAKNRKDVSDVTKSTALCKRSRFALH